MKISPRTYEIMHMEKVVARFTTNGKVNFVRHSLCPMIYIWKKMMKTILMFW